VSVESQLASIAGILDDVRGCLIVIVFLLVCILVGVCDVAKNDAPPPKQVTGTHG